MNAAQDSELQTSLLVSCYFYIILLNVRILLHMFHNAF